MVASLAEKIATSIKNANQEQTASIEVMKFALTVILNSFITMILIFIVGLVTGRFVDTLVVMFIFALIRAVSGGYHFKNSVLCMITSTVVIGIIPHIPLENGTLNYVLLIISWILVAIFAPSNIRNVTRFPESSYPVLKIISLILVSINFIISNPMITITYFVQSLSLIHFGGGEKK